MMKTMHKPSKKIAPAQERMTVAEFKALPQAAKRAAKPAKAATGAPVSGPKDAFLLALAALKLPMPQTEFRFHFKRRWRFDFVWREQKVAAEYQGIFGGEGENASHSSVSGLMRDYRKFTEAQLDGWLVLMIDAQSVASGEAVEWVERALRQRGRA